MDLVVTEQRKGNVLKLNFSVIFEGYKSLQKTSAEFNINDLAKVRLKFMATGVAIHLSLSLQKHELAQDSTVTVDVGSEILNYSKQWLCTDHWVDWQEMGVKQCQATENNHCLLVLPINITVTKGKSSLAENIFDDSDWTDFILTASDGSVAVHKACMAAHSDVFKTMFAREWKETAEGRIQIAGVTLQTLKYLKRYMYLGTVPDDEDDGLRPLLLIANCYLIDNLKSACISKLARTVTPENLEDLLNFAMDNKLTELIMAILQLTPDNVVHGAFEIKEKPKTEEKGGEKE